MSETFRSKVEKIENFESCTDELCAKYKYIKQLPEWSLQHICPKCQTDRICAALKERVEKLDKYKEKNVNNIPYTDHDGNKRIDKCKSYMLEGLE